MGPSDQDAAGTTSPHRPGPTGDRGRDAGAAVTGPRLVVVCGLPGAGKTTVARAVADRLDGRIHRTDVVRKDLFEDPDYTDAEERAVYEALFDRAAATLADGTTAILDGTFHDRTYRDRAERVADAAGVPVRHVRVVCAESVVESRMARREDDESDATFEIHRRYRELFDDLEREHVRVDNADSLERTREQVRAAFPTGLEAD